MILRWVSVFALVVLVGCGSAPFQPATPLDPTFVSTLTLSRDWTVSLQDGTFPMRQPFAPVTVAGLVYAVTDLGRVTGIRAESGVIDRQWELAVPVSIGLATNGTALFWGSQNGALVSMDLNGVELWRAVLTSRALSLPTVGGGLVYVQTQDGYLVALDESTGEQLWVYDDGVPRLSLYGDASPLLANGQLIAAFASGRVVGFDPATGEQLWAQNLGQASGRSDLERINDADGIPVVVNSSLLLASSYQEETLLIDTQTGAPLKRYGYGSRHGVIPFADQVVVLLNDDRLVGIAPKTGDLLWENDSLQYRRLTDATAWQGYVTFGDSFGWLHILDPKTGTLVARFPADHLGISGKPVSAGENLYVQGDSGHLKAFHILGH